MTFGDEEIPFPLRAAQARRGYVTLGDGSRCPDRWLERWRVAALGDETGDGTVRFDQERAWAWPASSTARTRTPPRTSRPTRTSAPSAPTSA